LKSFSGAKKQNEAVITNSCAGGVPLEPLVEGSQLSFPGRNVKANWDQFLLGKAGSTSQEVSCTKTTQDMCDSCSKLGLI